LCVCVRAYIPVCVVRACVRLCVCTRACVCVCARARVRFTHTHTHTLTHSLTHSRYIAICIHIMRQTLSLTQPHTHTRTHTHTHTHTIHSHVHTIYIRHTYVYTLYICRAHVLCPTHYKYIRPHLGYLPHCSKLGNSQKVHYEFPKDLFWPNPTKENIVIFLHTWFPQLQYSCIAIRPVGWRWGAGADRGGAFGGRAVMVTGSTDSGLACCRQLRVTRRSWRGSTRSASTQSASCLGAPGGHL